MNKSPECESIPVRDHAGAMLMLLAVALGDVFEVRDDGVWLTIPGTNQRGAAPVPLVVLDAVEEAGYLTHNEHGTHCTERGLSALRRWGPRAFGRQSWRKLERRLKPPAW